MSSIGIEAAEVVLDSFIEGLFRMMLDHHQAHVAEAELTLVQAQALKLLRGSPLPTCKLAAALGISAPAVTQLTDRLARKHLIERQSDTTDRRAVLVAATEKGGRVIDSFRKRRNEVFSAALSQLNDEDQIEVVSALRKISVVLQGEGEPKRVLNNSFAERRPRHDAQAQLDGRTKAEPPEASNEVVQTPVSLPTRRMRIEWD